MDISIFGEHLLISLVPWLAGVLVGGGLGYGKPEGSSGPALRHGRQDHFKETVPDHRGRDQEQGTHHLRKIYGDLSIPPPMGVLLLRAGPQG